MSSLLINFTKFIFVVLLFVIDSSRAQIIFPTEETNANVENFGQCFSPNRERGLCIYLRQCGDLFTLLQKNPLYDHERQFLSRSQCGYYNGNVLVCCPPRSISPGEVVTTQRPTREPTRQPSEQAAGNVLPRPPQCGGGLHERIYGGNRTKIDEFPWMVLLEYTKPGNAKGFHCGGSLINSRYVITASHCVNGRAIPSDWTLTSVRLGEWDTSSSEDCEYDDCSDPVLDVPIERTIPHEEYNPSSKHQLNDIALIRLARPVKYTDWIKPICLPSANHLRNAVFDGVSLDVAGWGKTEKASVSNIKLKARVDGISLEDCKEVYRRHSVELRNSQLCAGGEKGIDSCRGDSGGPLIGLDTSSRPYYYLAGVVSFGPTPCGLEGWPGVYTKVAPYMDWIESRIQP